MNLVYAKATVWVSSSVQLREGEAWYADDPLVKRRPDLFTDTPRIVRTTLSRQQIAEREAPVEQATRAPGERRATRRRRKRVESPPESEQQQEAPEGDAGDE